MDKIATLRVDQVKLFKAQSSDLILNLTHAACVDLNATDPSAAILNPICREHFTKFLHPDIEFENDFTEKLDIAEAANRKASAKLQSELSALQIGSSTSKGYAAYNDIIEDALTPCD